MIARAPGKIVLSGAYAVLEGAPAIVTAVDRYAVADSERKATFVTEEVRAALGAERAPWFDASALRSGEHKLGLGSSAAILVASMGAVLAAERGIRSDDELRRAVFEDAILAHRSAQGGGSGIDVAASVHGGTLAARRSGDSLAVQSVTLPETVVLDVWFAGKPASTPELVGRVREYRARAPAEYAALVGRLTAAAERAVRAAGESDGVAFVEALDAQRREFVELGQRASAGIVTPEVGRLAALAARQGGTVLPAGAGGGDVAFYAGPSAPSPELLAAVARENHERLGLGLAARGLHLPARPPPSPSPA